MSTEHQVVPVPSDELAQLKSDCLTLALRLYGENPDTFAPETREVMRRWGPRCTAVLMGEPVEWHDFRDRAGKPMEKRDPGSWSDWPNRPDGYQPGGRR